MNDITIRTKPEPHCPDCGAKMVLRRPRAGQRWRPFWGCPDWPDCHGKRQIGGDGLPESDEITLEDFGR
jgi:ssDNA-binding Zn-finger/Zn-ribbon topoisomerase 1